MSHRAGIYVHIPYCRSICPYCSFNVAVAKSPPWEEFGQALKNELATRAPLLKDREIVSVYFGGGTPSLAPPKVLRGILEAIRENVLLQQDVEVSLEVEPDTVTKEGLRDWKELGINRLSLGWQSTHDEILKTLGRGHTAKQSITAFEQARAAGFSNISCDLIFAVPGQNLRHLEQDLYRLLEYAPEHVSIYSLTYHERTPFFRARSRGKIHAVDEDTEAQMMDVIDAQLHTYGFEHYEVSNFAKPGQRSLHNGLYWQACPYVGIGPGAHSYMRDAWSKGWRWENMRSPKRYTAFWQQLQEKNGPLPVNDSVEWCEELEQNQLLAELMMCGLRTTDGVALTTPEIHSYVQRHESNILQALGNGWLRTSPERLWPTNLGMRMADSMAALFF